MKTGTQKERGCDFYNRIKILFWLSVLLFSVYQLSAVFNEYRINSKVLAEAQELYGERIANIEKENIAMYTISSTEPHNQIFEAVKAKDMSVMSWLDAKNNSQAGREKQKEIRPQLHPLLELNPEIVGWITLEGTPIHYPVVQSTDNDFYLTRNYLGEPEKAGSIFMDFRNNSQGSNRNTIIYGHNMKDGSMFGQLKKLLDEKFFHEHSRLTYDTWYESYEIEIFSVYRTTTSVDYIQTDFGSDAEYTAFLQEAQDRSVHHTNTIVTSADQIFTLSTCDAVLDPVEGRLVIHGKLVKLEEKQVLVSLHSSI